MRSSPCVECSRTESLTLPPSAWTSSTLSAPSVSVRKMPDVAVAIDPTPLRNCITNQMPRKKIAGTSMI